ncbi:hypothetical protein CARUB_v10027120mg [Capsella rubella]|uniref:GCK domain-containing protein n=1 Tax=Capsella rubella TaxID=81985 RepID=R0EXM2_9BRAS|nr:uncharacterized protein LOC17876736 [Capsella rubella]EOA13987.1 hypothetical protein CARUB_v10027120mg [Capsella rubella]
MGSVNSVAEAKTEEDPSTYQRDGEQTKALIEEDQGAREGSKDLSEDQIQKDVEGSKTLIEDLNVTEEGEDEECGLCKYIKGGECKDAFIELERCWDEAKKNDEDETSKCKEARLMFKACKNDNPVYYEPILALEARVMAKMLSELLYEEKKAIMAGEAAVIERTLSGLKEDDAEPITILPAEAAAIGKAFSDLEARKKKEKEAERSKGNESDHQN